MAKDILALLGLDATTAFIIGATDPSFLKVILGVGIVSLLTILFISKQGRASIYGANLMMAFIAATHYL